MVILRFIWLLALPFYVAAASSDTDTLSAALEQQINQSGFNGAILVGKQGELVVEKYIGFADTENITPLNQQHIFSPGSVGKEFTTVGLLILERQGRIAFNDKISSYLDNLPEWAGEVTIHQVLSHTSGFPKIQWKKNIATADAVSQIRNSEGAFEPGQGYLYSNLNVVIRALIIEKITGKSFASFLATLMFKPAGMTSAYQQLTADDVSEHHVVGDYPTFLNGVTVYVTPRDLYHFELALTKGVFVPFDVIKSTLEGDELSGQKNRALYDFGSFSMDASGRLASWKHDGSNPSHHTLKFHDFDKDIIIVIMSSDGNKSSLFTIKDIVLQHLSGE